MRREKKEWAAAQQKPQKVAAYILRKTATPLTTEEATAKLHDILKRRADKHVPPSEP